ncbi:energy-coupling factor transporter transmembrane protein EcfT [bacterium]|nr:energy-coupling factor transporter transmembrane protein EcfT [bacterium]
MFLKRDISLGQYIYRESFIHNLDPRLKLISLFVIGIWLIFLKGNIALLFFCLPLIYMVFKSRIPFKIWYKGFRIFLWFFFIILFFYIWSESRPFQIDIAFFLRLRNGLSSGVLAAIRWAILIGFCLLFTMTTSPPEITTALESLLKPLKKIGFPVHELSIMAGLTLHFLPVLKEETDRLIRIKTVQGIDFEADNFIERLQNIIRLISPLIHRLFRHSETLAMAMESRGYSYNKANAERDV